jgi:hypothetical protein
MPSSSRWRCTKGKSLYDVNRGVCLELAGTWHELPVMCSRFGVFERGLRALFGILTLSNQETRQLLALSSGHCHKSSLPEAKQ